MQRKSTWPWPGRIPCVSLKWVNVVITRLRRRRQWHLSIRHWRANGSPAPPPHALKAHEVWAYGRNVRTLVETGTYHGAMIEAVRPWFDRIVSIELDPDLFRAAADKYAHDPGVTVLEGNSATLLAPLVADLAEPAVFWLDAHYSGDGTAFSSVPILAELNSVLRSTSHVVLIDDADCFNGTDGYPTVSEVREFVGRIAPSATVEVADNIIRISPDDHSP